MPRFAMPGPAVYARVDGVIDEHDHFLLMELEVFEPVMYLAYHPEAAAGPHDSMYLFDRFVGLMS